MLFEDEFDGGRIFVRIGKSSKVVFDSGRYGNRITYRDHARPLALKILERTRA